MRVIPVIDLKSGQVVRAVAGRRDTYRPIVSRLAGSAAPSQVARAFVDQLGCDEVYLADLDAIAGRPPAFPDYEAIAAAGLKLLVDAGLDSERRAARLCSGRKRRRALAGIVVGLESVASPQVLAELAGALDGWAPIFSLDLRGGRPYSQSSSWSEAAPLEIVALAVRLGFCRLIVLDLEDVGVGSGTSTAALCRQIRGEFPDLELIAGGGVRGPADLALLADSGCDAALVASALHDGCLSRAELIRHTRAPGGPATGVGAE